MGRFSNARLSVSDFLRLPRSSSVFSLVLEWGYIRGIQLLHYLGHCLVMSLFAGTSQASPPAMQGPGDCHQHGEIRPWAAASQVITRVFSLVFEWDYRKGIQLLHYLGHCLVMSLFAGTSQASPPAMQGPGDCLQHGVIRPWPAASQVITSVFSGVGVGLQKRGFSCFTIGAIVLSCQSLLEHHKLPLQLRGLSSTWRNQTLSWPIWISFSECW